MFAHFLTLVFMKGMLDFISHQGIINWPMPQQAKQPVERQAVLKRDALLMLVLLFVLLAKIFFRVFVERAFAAG